jgi:hypothetical protein
MHDDDLVFIDIEKKKKIKNAFLYLQHIIKNTTSNIGRSYIIEP